VAQLKAGNSLSLNNLQTKKTAKTKGAPDIGASFGVYYYHYFFFAFPCTALKRGFDLQITNTRPRRLTI
jgi:hypothetical protein